MKREASHGAKRKNHLKNQRFDDEFGNLGSGG
jgi:hypothetical protein